MKYVLLVMCILFLAACKKEKDKSLTELVNKTVWMGELKHIDRDYTEPYSIEFDGNGGYKWFDGGGEGAGTYILDEANGTISLTKTAGYGFSFAFTVKGNGIGETEHPQYGLYTIVHGALSSAYTPSLDNTTWTGTIKFYGADKIFEWKFKPFTKMSYLWEPDPHTADFSYTRNKACISYVYGSRAFGVIKGDSIIGVYEFGTEYTPFRIKRK